jgi:hypothetical protein
VLPQGRDQRPGNLLALIVAGKRTGLRQLSARLSAGDGFLVAARALGLEPPCQVAGLVPARRQLAHAHRAVLRVDAAATTHVPGFDVRKRIVRAAVVHRHGVWIMPLPLRYYTSSRRDAAPTRCRTHEASPRRELRQAACARSVTANAATSAAIRGRRRATTLAPRRSRRSPPCAWRSADQCLRRALV